MRIKLAVFVLYWSVMRKFLPLFMHIRFHLYYTNLIKNPHRNRKVIVCIGVIG